MPQLRVPTGAIGSIRDAGTMSGSRTRFGLSDVAILVADNLIEAIESVVRDTSTYWTALLVHQAPPPQTPTETMLDVIDSRLAELANLSNGWMNGEGVAPRESAVSRARRLLFSASEFAMPRPQLFPTLDGGVQAEWTNGTIEMSVVFEPDSPVLEAIAVNTATGRSVETQIPGGRPDLLSQFVRSPRV